MKIKRFLSITLSIMMLLSLIPNAFAFDDLSALQIMFAQQQAEYQRQLEAMQQEYAQMQQTARQQVEQAQADAQKAYKQATCPHNYKTVQKRDVVPPTCETDGSHTEVTICLDCGLELGSKKVVDKVLGHDTMPTEKEQESEIDKMKSLPEGSEEASPLLRFPQSMAVAYRAERTEIGTISVSGAENYAYGQTISVMLEYSSFGSTDYSIPVTITSMQNGVEQIWADGTERVLKMDGSDPLTMFVNITPAAWEEAPHGAYEMKLKFKTSTQES